jgi:Heavy metal binding domain
VAPSIPFVCPMDPDVRSAVPAKCPRCGMKLVAGIPDSREFAVDLTLNPRPVRAGAPVRMRFAPRDPKTFKPAKLQLIHEKLLHLFVVRADLGYFAHEHPELQSDGSFVFETALPGGGEYRLLCDFYPENGTPQMIGKTVYAAGPAQPRAALAADLDAQRGSNLTVSLRMDPPKPLAGTKTMLFFRLEPGDGLEPYLGAWGHMLAASADLADMIHTHPAWEDKSDTIQFNVIFPRPGLHRVWVQFQRLGVLNTVGFTIPVAAI